MSAKLSSKSVNSSLSVVSYNIHKGFGVGNRQYLLAQMRQAIRRLDADIVFLQEVTGQHLSEQQSSVLESQFEYLADSVWPHFAYGRNAIYDKGDHGNAILSKYPFVDYENIPLKKMVPRSHRGVLHGRIQIPGGQVLNLFCVHLGLFGFERRQQLKGLIGSINTRAESPEAVILAGDFNDWPMRASNRLLKLANLKEVHHHVIKGRHLPTYPAHYPVLSVDRVYSRGLEVQAADVLRGSDWQKLSDHCPIHVRFGFSTDAEAIESMEQ